MKTFGRWVCYALGGVSVLFGVLMMLTEERDWGTIGTFGAIGFVLIATGRNIGKPGAAGSSSSSSSSSGSDYDTRDYVAAGNDSDSSADSDSGGGDND